ncbi:MAG: cytochrome-c peroxidase [Nitrospinae bacterium]|nr:cytochrome-c peroxidase [Nitrospinota bacterium]
MRGLFRKTCLLFVIAGLAIVFFRIDSIAAEYKIVIPLGLPADYEIPKDNPMTPEKVELGRLLYFDKRLSVDDTVACASCHSPDFGFTDGKPVSAGVGSLKGGRSAPTVINRLYSKAQFWDGRAGSLEEQAAGPIVNPIEMGMPSHPMVVNKLNTIDGYRKLFKKVFGSEEITLDKITKAIAAFERTVLSGNSPFDRRKFKVDMDAMTESQLRGQEIFMGKASCTSCHAGFNFTDESFHNVGVGMDKAKQDLGRYDVTKKEEDKGKFKTTTLRDVERTAPYMHDGSFKTLEDVVEFYNKGGVKNPQLDKDIKPLNLTPQEKKDLVEFLKALNGEPWQNLISPMAFPY